MEEAYYVGVDVGSSSVRAALVTHSGRLHKTHTLPITVSNPQPDFYEQDSEEIWGAVCGCVKVVTEDVPDKTKIHGLGFDATCSLVVLDEHLRPITVSPATGEDRFNIIMWMDHRAKKEADIINFQDHKVLRYVGGKVSLEMQTPKLLWLKTHMADTWSRAAHFLDLPDYLTFRATGKLSRSLCSVVCKWTYLCEDKTQGWDKGFFDAVGLGDLADQSWAKIGQEVLAPGTRCGCLTPAAAQQTGLDPHTPVGTSIIDAHAGGLALAAAGAGSRGSMEGRLGLICGTSTCHMCVSKEAIFVPGVWGPYYSAMVPGTWLAEGGQSATGALVDHIINSHPAATALTLNTHKSKHEKLEEVLAEMSREQNLSSSALLTTHLHLYPDYHGNRSPLADPSMVGMVSGLTLDTSERSLALTYLSAIQALAYGTRQIMERLTLAGHRIQTVLMCGGLSNSPTFIQTHADVLGMPVLLPEVQQAVLLGAAMLGAAASGDYQDMTAAARAMGGQARVFEPRQDLKGFFDKKYAVFKRMQANQKEYEAIMLGGEHPNKK